MTRKVVEKQIFIHDAVFVHDLVSKLLLLVSRDVN